MQAIQNRIVGIGIVLSSAFGLQGGQCSLTAS